MPGEEELPRRHALPILYTRGTHYDVGFDMGRTFSGLIKSFLASAKTLNDDFLPAYETPKGKQVYADTLNAVKTNFPQYLRELEGIAEGAQVPFYKLFLLHMDNIILTAVGKRTTCMDNGCTTISVNDQDQIIGHTEDALYYNLNHFYFVNAHIIDDGPMGKWGVKEERFMSLCYAGHLPGYTMNYNYHGLVFSINTLSAAILLAGKVPRHFLTRALLSANNFEKAQKILRNSGCGAGDGCSINMTFLDQEGDRLIHNIEMGPAYDNNESQLNVLTLSPGESFIHVNKYLRLDIDEIKGYIYDSSVARINTLSQYPRPTRKEDVLTMLSDTTNSKFPVFNDHGPVRTLAAGIFDCVQRTWSIYAANPAEEDRLVVIPLEVINFKKH